MKLNVRSWMSGVALASALLLSACGGGGGSTGGGGGGAPAALNVSTAGEQLQFAPGNLSAAPGDVKVTFKNGSGAQKHNWVLVKGGDDVAAKVDEAGVAAGDAKGYIPDDANILAHTKLVDGGGSDSISFKADPGTYTFLCTFPGHYTAGMKGTLTVK
ncbi:MAG TPA: plastocyanin/azurin family copper-binding protein [Kouleothrix sp.]|uniref:plastocyanin/azurin family copper-binding protein n=1 Tax=Kouleothrix sp. TaxID=2779161 RepID=UPI002D0DCC79|nr:plastocyanin/azurin family copper-binding protein [Kouleothrix sp.]HRC77716.1 plastocyanin/azurin family copper-binding protein [Kouleothrix sp.]